jgi:hypothetical protein
MGCETERDPVGSVTRTPDLRRIRVRGMVVGTALTGCVAAGLPYNDFLLQSTFFGMSSSTPAAFCLFFALLLLNTAVAAGRPAWRLNRCELLLALVMMMLASAIATRGFTGVFVAILAAPYYYATPENGWVEKLHPHLPSWIVPRDAAAVRGFFEGLDPGQPIPWSAWLPALGWWLVLMGALCCVLVCMMVILRRQWMDHERLPYPLMQVPEAMTEEGSGRLQPFLRRPLVWLGFAIPFCLHSFNALAQLTGLGTPVSLVSGAIPIFRRTVALNVSLEWLVLGLAYLINTGVAFSLWFFYLLAKCQVALYVLTGVRSTVELDSTSLRGPIDSIMSFQVMGAMIALVVLGLWSARTHLGAVWREARAGSAPSGEGELVPYRAAVIGLVAGLATMVVWLWCSGLPLWAAAMFLFGAFAVYLALTRVVVEAGMVTALQGLTGAGFTMAGAGTSALGLRGMLGLGFTMPWAGDHMVFLMAPVANGLRLLHGFGRDRGRVLAMVAAAMLTGLVGSVAATLALGYRHGGLNLWDQYFRWFAQEPYRVALLVTDPPTQPYWAGWGWMGQGALVMGALTLLRQRLLWWPLHPIGFAVSGTWLLNHTWFSIFVAWLVKVLVLRYAGLAGYRSSRQVFLGIFLGHVSAGGFWQLVRALTGLQVSGIGMY